MSKGANSQAGFNAQNWAALSLFVQHSGYTAFQRIELEQPRLADFVLVFNSKRIICESKKSHITYADVREILDTIPSVNDQDEILIICTSTGPRLKEDLDNARYFPQVQEELVKKHQFTVRHLELIPKIKLWVVDKDMNEDIVRSLLAERFQSWLPDDELDDLLSSLLVKNIYDKSAKGGVYTRAEFNEELQKRRELLKQKDDYKHDERSAKEIIDKLMAELSDTDSRLQSDNRLKAVIADSRLHYFALQEITKAKDLNISLWNSFWLATFSSYYSREVLRIFEDNVKDEESATYVVSFIKENVHKLRFRNMEEYEFKSTADILMKAVGVSDSLIGDVFELLKKLYAYSTENPLFIENGSKGRDEWLMGELANGFETLYAKGEETLKADIVDYIYGSFDIVGEEYKYWHGTPFKFFEILKDDLLAKPSSFNKFLEHVRLQYINDYKRFKVKYDGWELMGGSVSNFGGDYEVHDRAFINMIIRPHLNRLTNEKKWKIVDEYVSLKVGQVSEYKPDFMNRALIPFLIEEYANESDKAFKILSEFTKMRKGIPHKAELIFFYVRDSQTMTLEKKWQLLNVAIKEFGFPINVFMDQVLWELLEKKHTQAIETFSGLLGNKDYMHRQIMFDVTIIQSLIRIIKNSATFDQGTVLLEEFLHSEYFTESLDSFHSYDAKAPILDVLNKDFDRGILLIKSLIAKKPSDNQQRVFGAVLRDISDEYLDPIFSQIIKPEIQQAKNAAKLAQKYTNTETRENFIWFAEKLSKKHKFDDAMYIAEFFLDDPSPSRDDKYDKEVIEGKYDFTISTVRGCIAWILLPVNSLPGRIYTERAFEITKKLCTDESLYVRQMSLLLLESLANNRHTTMPDSKEWFMDYSIAKGIEDFAFSMLDDKANYHNAIMRHLARVFNRIRTLNEDQAVKVINIFAEYGDRETLKELDSLIIFLAEFRKGAFRNWPRSRGTIPPYDPKPVQAMLKNFLENGSDEHRESLVWHIVKLPEEPIRNNGDFDKFFNISNKYLTYAIKKYDHTLFSSLHRFLEHYMDRRFKECYKLWRKSLDVERPVMVTESQKNQHPGEYNWWPYHYNGSILLKVLENLGTEQFLRDFEFLVDYPEQAMFAYDIDKVLVELEKITANKDTVKRIYEKLITKNYLFNSSYENWLTNSA